MKVAPVVGNSGLYQPPDSLPQIFPQLACAALLCILTGQALHIVLRVIQLAIPPAEDARIFERAATGQSLAGVLPLAVEVIKILVLLHPDKVVGCACVLNHAGVAARMAEPA